MAKTRMICPFSDNLCKECAFYRGRHYYLCFCKKYRGYVDEPREVTKVSIPATPGISSNKKFETPSVIPTTAVDPFTTSLKDIKKEV